MDKNKNSLTIKKAGSINQMVDVLLDHYLLKANKDQPYYLSKITKHVSDIVSLFELASSVDNLLKHPKAKGVMFSLSSIRSGYSAVVLFEDPAPIQSKQISHYNKKDDDLGFHHVCIRMINNNVNPPTREDDRDLFDLLDGLENSITDLSLGWGGSDNAFYDFFSSFSKEGKARDLWGELFSEEKACLDKRFLSKSIPPPSGKRSKISKI